MLFVVIALLSTSFYISNVYASGDEANINATSSSSEIYEVPEEVKKNSGNASETALNNLSSKDKKIKEYTEKLNGNATNGTVLYYLYEIQSYSIPVCFVGLVIASLNFFIIGNKKLEKREQGFRMLVTLIIGLIVFQVLPLLFAIIVAGR